MGISVCNEPKRNNVKLDNLSDRIAHCIQSSFNGKRIVIFSGGPAKGKDFASSFGPYMVTKDELSDAWDDQGNLNLRMTCHVNDKLISDGNTNDLYHSFGDMIERASLNTNLLPGDYIGSGTVGTGCILELLSLIHI